MLKQLLATGNNQYVPIVEDADRKLVIAHMTGLPRQLKRSGGACPNEYADATS